MNKLSDREQQGILSLINKGFTMRMVSRITGHNTTTISKLLKEINDRDGEFSPSTNN